MRNKVLGVFLVIITVPFIILSIFTMAFSSLKNPLFYKQVFQKYDVYNSATLAIRSLPAATDNKNFWSAVIPQITSDWLRENTVTNLDNFNLYLTEKNANFDFYLNIAPFKDDIIKNMPTGLNPTDIPDKLTFSNYGDILNKLQETQSTLTQQASNSSNQIENQININNDLQKQFSSNSSNIKTGFRLFNIYSYILYAIAVLLLALIGIAARRNLKSMFRWLAATLLISNGLVFIPAFFVKKCGVTYINISSDKLTPQTSNFLQILTKAMASELAYKIVFICLIIGGVGLLFLLVSFFVPGSKKAKKEPQKAPAPQITEVKDVS